MAQFPRNDIISLVGAAPRHDLAESTGPDLLLGECLGDQDDPLRTSNLHYGSAAGDAGLRRAIADAYGANADDVVVTAGGQHALFLLAFTLCDRDDEAIVSRPGFPMPAAALEAVGARVRTLPLRFDDGYQPDVSAFAALLSPRTRFVCLASPQNPSGVTIDPDRLREMLAAMSRLAPQARLCIDETYRDAAHGDAPTAPSALGLDPRILSVSSVSKCHGAPGLRIGWIVVRDAVLRESLVRAKFNTVISCPPLTETLALAVLERQDAIVGERRLRFIENLDIVADWVERRSAELEWVRPDAGALCCVRLRPEVFDDAAVECCHAAMGEQDVRVARGDWFGEQPRIFRLGFGLADAPGLRLALDALGRALDAGRHDSGFAGR